MPGMLAITAACSFGPPRRRVPGVGRVGRLDREGDALFDPMAVGGDDHLRAMGKVSVHGAQTHSSAAGDGTNGRVHALLDEDPGRCRQACLAGAPGSGRPGASFSRHGPSLISGTRFR
ncbi:hypothetical protein EHYA_08371 [Embleya hyalina]|uniref:Uncharacterized protein n=1 Tax=Embleya hyalina TaxID=516124 RepID=A0A401Z1B4_9ACTN|nr:hypothetical protein EHYA_08371 [Embleya hyalina]